MYYLVTFADKLMSKTLNRVENQAKKLNFFDRIYLENESSLSKEFKEKFKDKLLSGSRGYGYWSWKPEIILNVLNKINEGDCLLYIDAGCHLNYNGKKRLQEYFHILEKDKNSIIAFQANEPNNKNSTLHHDGRQLISQKIYEWVKGDLIDYFNARDDYKTINSNIIGAGVILIKKSSKSLSIVKEWQKIIWTRFDLLDDRPSISKNLEGFIENRHDQAIWTLLCLKNKINTLSAYEYWYPKKTNPQIPDWYKLRYYPIHAKRDIDQGTIRNFFLNIKKFISFKIKNFKK